LGFGQPLICFVHVAKLPNALGACNDNGAQLFVVDAAVHVALASLLDGLLERHGRACSNSPTLE
jgi:hypothetical protein